MTYPPQGPDPYGPQHPSGQYGSDPFNQTEQAGPGYFPDGSQPQGFGQPGPYGQQQFDGNQQGYPGYPGYPGGEPPKQKTGLIVGLVLLGVLVVGGVVALILVLTGKDDIAPTAAGGPSTSSQAGATTKRSTTTRAPSTPTTTPPVATGNANTPAPSGQATPQALVDFLAKAVTEGNEEGYYGTICRSEAVPTPPEEFSEGLTFTVTEPVKVIGDTASFKYTLTRPDQKSFSDTFNMKKEAGLWCSRA